MKQKKRYKINKYFQRWNETYQSDTEKENLKNSSDAGGANYITIANGRHGHHQKVNALPVPQFMDITEIGGISAVLQLE
jgi:hypothetical protein